MKKHILWISSIIVIVALLLTFLNFSIKKPNNNLNGFTRKFNVTAIKLYNEIFPTPVIDIAGITDSSIYFTTPDPDKILRSNYNLKNPHLINLNISNTKRLKTNFNTIVKYPNIYIFGSNVPSFIQYDLTTGKEAIHKLDRGFSKNALLSPGSIVVRGFDSTRENMILRKINLRTDNIVEDDNIIDRNNDGGFSTDGKILYDSSTNTLIYVHFYSNKLIFLDTNLNLIHSGNTIDTFSAYQAKAISKVSGSKKAFSFVSPPKLINLYSTVQDRKLYVLSLLRADNEANFEINSTIDVYDIKRKEYEGSIHIPKFDKQELHKFKIYKDHIICLFKGAVAIFKLR